MRGITKQEFYRLRSKFRLLKRVYDDPESMPDIPYLTTKLSRKPLDGQLVQLVIAEPAREITQTFVDGLRQKLYEYKLYKCEINKTLMARCAKEISYKP